MPLPTVYRINGVEYRLHPAANAFPLLTGTYYKELVADIRANGVNQPVTVIEDMLLDGRNRVRAAQEAGRADDIPIVVLPPNADAVAVVASLNIHRRHLTQSQRAHAASELIRLAQAAYDAKHPPEPTADAFRAFDDELDPDSAADASDSGAGVPGDPAPVRDPDGHEHYGDSPDADAFASPDPAVADGEAAVSGDPSSSSSPGVGAAAPSSGQNRSAASPPAPSPAGVAGSATAGDSASDPAAAAVPPSASPPDVAAESAGSDSLPASSSAPGMPGSRGYVDLTDEDTGRLSSSKVIDAMGASHRQTARATRLHKTAPVLYDALGDGTITVRDAMRLESEPEEVQRQALADVRAGVAPTATRAIRQRYDREPVGEPAPTGAAARQPPPRPVPPPPGEVSAPSGLVPLAREVLGDIDLDPCSAAWCAERVGIPQWYGADEDGLLQDWSGRVWVFPPFERAEPFLSKTLLEFEEKRITGAVALVPATPCADATRSALASPYLKAVVVPSSDLSCKRPDGSTLRPDESLWLIVFGTTYAPPEDVFASFSCAVLARVDARS